MTGALSPVIALSSTEATPSITSPSPGMKSPASTSTTSPLPQLARGRSVYDLRVAASSARASFLAMMSRRGLRSASACALPRPSAIASAKLAKSTVNHSHSEIAQDEPGGRLALAAQRLDARARWSACCRPTTTNITGLLTWSRGSSLRNESTTARRTMRGIEERAGDAACHGKPCSAPRRSWRRLEMALVSLRSSRLDAR